jgi:uncharacterized protein with FMN-binding domain
MRRAILAVCGTAVATTLLVGAKSAATLADHGVAVGSASETPQPGVAASIAASANGNPAATASPSSPPPTKPGSKPTTAASSPALGGRYRDGTYAGSSASYKYGTVTVTITVSGGRITRATATYPTSGQSGVINGKAIPKLNQEVLTAQDADIATVSGATLTSAAYRTSLQAAVDRAKG